MDSSGIDPVVSRQFSREGLCEEAAALTLSLDSANLYQD
jgi:hypothetical protein